MIPFKKFAVSTKLSQVIRRPSYNTLFSIMYHSTTDKDLSFGLTRTQMNKMKVGELREALEERHLDSKGTKKVLLERLREVIPSKNSGNKAQISSTSVKKSDSASNRTLKIQEYQKEFLDHEKIILSPTSVYVLQFDGGSRGNPGVSGSGMVLYDESGHEIWHARHFVGKSSTNNEAEYAALLIGLQCSKIMGAQNLVIQGDSELIVKQIQGKYRCKSPSLIPYYTSTKKLLNAFKTWEICHIPRAQNSRADSLANDAMDSFDSNYMFNFLNSLFLGLQRS